jgi:hypothetical protein
MKSLQDIQTKIINLTTNIKVNYPELYVNLDEEPITIPSTAHPEMTLSIMKEYLSDLKQILKQYIKTHKIS